MQDLAIVGMGLIGSAALRHAAKTSAVVGIGPPEPSVWATHDGPFASHYDSGRVTRRLDAKREWAILAGRAIEQYPLIEAASEISFHRPTGLLFVRHDEAGAARLRSVAAELDIPIEEGDPVRSLAEKHGIALPESATVMAEPGPAGVIDPRAMVAAQHRAAKRDGALVARDTVMSIRPALDGFELLTVGGRTHQARNVLVAAGAYTGSLLRQELAVSIRPEAVVMAEVDRADAERLEIMPSIIHLLDHPDLDDVYINPPMTYPDGKTYIKIGGSHQQPIAMNNPGDYRAWMSADVPERSISMLRDVLMAVLPDVEFRSLQSKPCLITDTETGLPYIDKTDTGVTVAFGGNGHAAKSADAIGAMAAALALTGQWPDEELPASLFKTRYGSFQSEPELRQANR